MRDWLARRVARVPVSVHAKLLTGFLIIAALFITVGAAGLRVLSEVNRRAEELGIFQRKIAAYRQLQQNATIQLYRVASALLVTNERTFEATLRQLTQFGYDLERLQFVAQDEAALLSRVEEAYDRFIQMVTQVVELSRAGKVAEGRELQLTHASPIADHLERLMNELVNKAEAAMVARIAASHEAYVTARWAFIGFAGGGIGLALLLGYALSWSLIRPVQRMDVRLREIAAGDFSQQVEVSNRDEFGTLAANLNHMNEELARLYHQLDLASRHKSEFLANMSHELRTPLNSIIGFSEVLLDESLGELTREERREFLGNVLSSGRHLLALINDILDLSKVEAGRMELYPEAFAVADVIHGVVQTIQPLATRKQIAIEEALDPGLRTLCADPGKVKQILFNLLSNAVKFTPVGGRIGVRTVRGQGVARFVVWDMGIGIKPEDQERIFEEFQQVETAAARQYEGTGLGLALAQKFVVLHGGRIWVESTPSEGSTFTFTLPLSEPPLDKGGDQQRLAE